MSGWSIPFKCSSGALGPPEDTDYLVLHPPGGLGSLSRTLLAETISDVDETLLPKPVRAYVERTVGSKVARETRLRQVGELRLRPEGAWLPFTAHQTISAGTSSFSWKARVRMARLTTAAVEDAYQAGRGRLRVRLWGVLPILRAKGPTIDQAEAQRYLAELPWCPMALMQNPDLRFKEIGPRRVRVWMGEPATHVDLLFDKAGDIVGARTKARHRSPTLVQPWAGSFSDYRDFADIRAPTRGEVWWATPQGRFVYWRGQVESLVAAG